MKRVKAMVISIGVLVLVLSCCCCGGGGDWQDWEEWGDWEDWGIRSLRSVIVKAAMHGAATSLLVVGR
jgi:hypothetical protein